MPASIHLLTLSSIALSCHIIWFPQLATITDTIVGSFRKLPKSASQSNTTHLVQARRELLLTHGTGMKLHTSSNAWPGHNSSRSSPSTDREATENEEDWAWTCHNCKEQGGMLYWTTKHCPECGHLICLDCHLEPLAPQDFRILDAAPVTSRPLRPKSVPTINPLMRLQPGLAFDSIHI
jgi:hypothetical protein